MSAKHQKFTVKIDKNLSPSERISIGNELISKLKKRTDQGLGVSGSQNSNGTYSSTYKFPSYSKEYIDSLPFKIAGKSAGKIDLKLTGDMLTDIEVLNHSDGEITIGFREGTVENAKAEGNNIGSYGKPNGDPGKARKFLGVTSQELTETLEKYKNNDEVEQIINEIDIFDNIDLEFL